MKTLLAILLLLPALLLPSAALGQFTVGARCYGISSSSPLQLWSGILSPSAGINWQTAGIPGGIPTATQSGSTIEPVAGDMTAAIQTALNSCGGTSSANKYVQLDAGTFQVNTYLSVPSYCNLIGKGADQTIINGDGTAGTGLVILGASVNSGPSSTNDTAVTGGLNAGSTSITVASATDIAVGSLLELSELNSTANNVVASGDEGATTNCDEIHNRTRCAGQTVLVTGVSGTTVTITPGLYYTYGNTLPTWSSVKQFYRQFITVGGNIYEETANVTSTPYACVPGATEPTFPSSGSVTDGSGLTACVWTYISAGTTTSPLATPFTPTSVESGLQNLQLYITNAGTTTLVGPNLVVNSCLYCYEQGVEDNYTDADHVYANNSFGLELLNNYYSNSILHTPGTYDSTVQLASKTSASLVQNNIFERLHTSMIFEDGASGNVFSYNYMMPNFDPGSAQAVYGSIDFHGPQPQFNLLEGNVGIVTDFDSVWGSSANNTTFRSWMKGAGKVNYPETSGRNTVTATGTITSCPPTTGETCQPFQSSRDFDVSYIAFNTNLIGNVTGSPDQVASIGYGSGVHAYNGGTGQTDALQWASGNVRSFDSTFYAYTFGYANDADADSFPLDNTNAWTSALLQGNYGNSSNAIVWVGGIPLTLPPSFYLTSKPSWWGALAYPAIGPDVTGGPGPGGHANLIPAENCYLNVMGGSDGSPASPLSFNAANCYSPQSAATPMLLPNVGSTGDYALAAPSPTLNFGNQGKNTSSEAIPISISNCSNAQYASMFSICSGSGPLTVASMAISGTNASDFTLSGTCGVIASGADCEPTVTFTPVATSGVTETATLTVNYEGGLTSQTMSLAGTSATVTALSTSACPTALAANTIYQLTADITCGGTAFTINGNNAEMNLNGHTVTYNNSTSSQLTTVTAYTATTPTASAWSSATNYVAGNLVSYSGYTFVARQGSTNQTPSSSGATTNYWTVTTIIITATVPTMATPFSPGQLVAFNFPTIGSPLSFMNGSQLIVLPSPAPTATTLSVAETQIAVGSGSVSGQVSPDIQTDGFEVASFNIVFSLHNGTVTSGAGQNIFSRSSNSGAVQLLPGYNFKGLTVFNTNVNSNQQFEVGIYGQNATIHDNILHNTAVGTCATVGCRDSYWSTNIKVSGSTLPLNIFNNTIIGGPQGGIQAASTGTVEYNTINPGNAAGGNTNDFGIYAQGAGLNVTQNSIMVPFTANSNARGILISGAVGSTTGLVVSNNLIQATELPVNGEYRGCEIDGAYGLQWDDSPSSTTASGNNITVTAGACPASGLRLTDSTTATNTSTGHTYKAIRGVAAPTCTPKIDQDLQPGCAWGVSISGATGFTSTGDTVSGDSGSVIFESSASGLTFYSPTLEKGSNSGTYFHTFTAVTGTPGQGGGSVTNVHFIDPTYGAGTSPTDINIPAQSGVMGSVSFFPADWTQSVTVTEAGGSAAEEASVTFTDTIGNTYNCTTDLNGKCSIAVPQYRVNNDTTATANNAGGANSIENRNPYSLAVSLSGCTTNTQTGLTISATTSLTITLSGCSGGSAVLTPTFSTPPGVVASGTEVDGADATSGATVYYTFTTDGSTPPDPTYNSSTYMPAYGSRTFILGTGTSGVNTGTDGIVAGNGFMPYFNVYGPLKIKMMAAKSGMSDSSIASASYTLSAPTGTGISACGTLAASTTYYLTADVSSTGNCFLPNGSNITLNLNGHTVTYGTGNGNVLSGSDLTTTSGSPDVSCSSCTFTSAMVGDRLYVDNDNIGGYSNNGALPNAAAVNIITVTDAQHVVMGGNIAFTATGAEYVVTQQPTYGIVCDSTISGGGNCPHLTVYNGTITQSHSASPNSNAIEEDPPYHSATHSYSTLAGLTFNISQPEAMAIYLLYSTGGDVIRENTVNDSVTLVYNRTTLQYPIKLDDGSNGGVATSPIEQVYDNVILGSPQGGMYTNYSSNVFNNFFNANSGTQYENSFCGFGAAAGATFRGNTCEGSTQGWEFEAKNTTFQNNYNATYSSNNTLSPNYSLPVCDPNFGARFKDYGTTSGTMTGNLLDSNVFDDSTNGTCPAIDVEFSILFTGDTATVSNNLMTIEMTAAANSAQAYQSGVLAVSGLYDSSNGDASGIVYSGNTLKVNGPYASQGYDLFVNYGGVANWTIPGLVNPSIYFYRGDLNSSMSLTGTGTPSLTCAPALGDSLTATWNGTSLPCP